jgi:hypothetical protein
MQLMKLWRLCQNITENTEICDWKLHQKITALNVNLFQNES